MTPMYRIAVRYQAADGTVHTSDYVYLHPLGIVRALTYWGKGPELLTIVALEEVQP